MENSVTAREQIAALEALVKKLAKRVEVLEAENVRLKATVKKLDDEYEYQRDLRYSND